MKKTILTILITAIICITGTVIASNYLASEIVYNDTTVDQALDELYTVHETYKNLNNDTTVTPDKLLEGITAYNKNGELVTGNINTDCVYQSHVITSSDLTNGVRLTDYIPSIITVYASAPRVNSTATFNWNSNEPNVKKWTDYTAGTISNDTNMVFTSSSISFNPNSVEAWLDATLKWVACK